MNSKKFLLQPLALAALFAVSGASHAALTVFTNQASFLSTITAVGVDGYNGFSIVAATNSPITRTAGAYTYTAAASSSSFFGAGTVANPWLSTNVATDSITFSGFSPNVVGIGGNFFGSDINGLFAAGNITLVATDSLGAISTQTITAATVSSFLGFRSTGTITSLVVASVQGATPLWPTVDNLTMGVAAVGNVPEPETYALMLAGLGVVGFMARRRRT